MVWRKEIVIVVSAEARENQREAKEKRREAKRRKGEAEQNNKRWNRGGQGECVLFIRRKRKERKKGKKRKDIKSESNIRRE